MAVEMDLQECNIGLSQLERNKEKGQEKIRSVWNMNNKNVLKWPLNILYMMSTLTKCMQNLLSRVLTLNNPYNQAIQIILSLIQLRKEIT